MKKVLLFCSLFFIPLLGYASTVPVYTGTITVTGSEFELGDGMVFGSDGSIYFVSDFETANTDFDSTSGTDTHTPNGGFGGADIAISKYNSDLSYGWTRTFGGEDWDVPAEISITSDGKLVVIGDFYEDLAGIDFDGTAGTDTHFSNGNSDVFLTKYNTDGTYDSTITFGGTAQDIPFGLAIDSSDNIYVGGRFSSTVDFNGTAGTDNKTSVGSTDGFLAKYTNAGAYGWTYTIGSTTSDEITSVAVDSSDNVYIVGKITGTDVDLDGTAGTDLYTVTGTQPFISKYDSSGNYVWSVVYGANLTIPADIYTDSSGNVYVTGSFQGSNIDLDGTAGTDTYSSSGGIDGFIVSYDTDGGYRWAQTFGGSGGDSFEDIFVDSSDNIFVDGSFTGTVDINATSGMDTRTASGTEDLFVSKYDTSGAYSWSMVFGGNDSGSEDFEGVVVSNSGVIGVVGSFDGTGSDLDGTYDQSFYSSVGNSDIFVSFFSQVTPSVTVTQPSGTLSEVAPATPLTYSVVLTTSPSSDVDVIATPDSQSSIASDTLTFTSLNWDTAQTFSVVPIDDTDDEADTHTTTITHTASSSDSTYSSLSLDSVAISILDNDLPNTPIGGGSYKRSTSSDTAVESGGSGSLGTTTVDMLTEEDIRRMLVELIQKVIQLLMEEITLLTNN